MVTLGIDASSVTVGFAFVEDAKILNCGFIDISKLKSRKQKALYVVDQLSKNSLLKKVTKINLESPMGSGPNAKTVNVLNKWNAVLEFVLEDRLSLPVNLIVSTTARKKVFGIGRIKGVNAKIFVNEQLSKIIPNIDSFYIKNKKNDLDKRNEDVRDAIVMALFD